MLWVNLWKQKEWIHSNNEPVLYKKIGLATNYKWILIKKKVCTTKDFDVNSDELLNHASFESQNRRSVTMKFEITFLFFLGWLWCVQATWIGVWKHMALLLKNILTSTRMAQVKPKTEYFAYEKWIAHQIHQPIPEQRILNFLTHRIALTKKLVKLVLI